MPRAADGAAGVQVSVSSWAHAGGGREREVKLEAYESYSLPDLTGVFPGAVVAALPPRHLRATYWDTADLRLVRSGVSLRFRDEGEDGSRWTLKLPADSPGSALLVRRELDFEGDHFTVPETIVRLVRAFTRRAPLGPVVDLESRRSRLQLRDRTGRPAAEIDDDRVSVFEGGRATGRFRELEVELAAELAPEERAAISRGVVTALRKAGASDPEPVAKVVRALGPRARAPGDLVVAPPGMDARAGELVRACLADGVARLVTHDPRVRLGDDPEEIHQARVATRRLRSDLRSLGPLVESSWAAHLRDELRWVAGPLGRARDADVLLQRLWSSACGLPVTDVSVAAKLLEGVAARGEQARLEVVRILDSERYLDLLDSLYEAVRSPALDEAAAVPARIAAPALVAEPWRELRKAVRGVGESPRPEEMHRVRIAAKRCRYAAETAGIVIGRPALRMARAIRELQDVLGDLQDAVVAEAWLREAGGGEQARTPQESLVLGEMVAEQRRSAEAAMARWPEAWGRASCKRLRRWLG